MKGEIQYFMSYRYWSIDKAVYGHADTVINLNKTIEDWDDISSIKNILKEDLRKSGIEASDIILTSLTRLPV